MLLVLSPVEQTDEILEGRKYYLLSGTQGTNITKPRTPKMSPGKLLNF